MLTPKGPQAFMLKRRKNVSQYLEFYRRNDSTRIQLLSQRNKYHGREARPLESVLTTWWISFESIKTENPRAAELLSIMSFLDRQGIPDSLITLDDDDSFAFDDAIGLLCAFSLISRDPSGNASEMHRLGTPHQSLFLSFDPLLDFKTYLNTRYVQEKGQC